MYTGRWNMTEVNDPLANNVTINIEDPANSYIVVVRANERCRGRGPHGQFGCPTKRLRPIRCTVEYNPQDTGIGTGTQQEAERMPDQAGGPNSALDPTMPPNRPNRPDRPMRPDGPGGFSPDRRGSGGFGPEQRRRDRGRPFRGGSGGPDPRRDWI